MRKIKVLGVCFGTVPVDELNWQPKITKLEKLINLWKSRSLSCVHKAMISNVTASIFFFLSGLSDESTRSFGLFCGLQRSKLLAVIHVFVVF